MLLDHRTYTVRRRARCASRLRFTKNTDSLCRSATLAIRWRGSSAETGDVNSYVHIWVYDDAEDRNRKRAAMNADPEWQAYIEMNAEAGYLLSQESKLMSPAPFAPIKR